MTYTVVQRHLKFDYST